MASLHLSGDRKLFRQLRPCDPVEVEVANGQIVTAKQKGGVSLRVSTTDSGHVSFVIDDVYYHESFSANLLSWNVLRAKGWTFVSDKSTTTMTTPGGNAITLNTRGRVSIMEATSVDVAGPVAPVYSVGTTHTSGVRKLVHLHEKLGHVGFRSHGDDHQGGQDSRHRQVQRVDCDSG